MMLSKMGGAATPGSPAAVELAAVSVGVPAPPPATTVEPAVVAETVAETTEEV